MVELVSRRPEVVTSALVRTDGADGEEQLRTGAFRTIGQSIQSVLEAMFLGSADFPVGVCRAILAGAEPGPVPVAGGSGGVEDRSVGARRDGVPATPVVGRVARHFVGWQSARLTWGDGWNVGIAMGPISAFLTGPRPEVRWLPELSGSRLLADPFGIREENGRLRLILEVWDLRTGAALRAVDIEPDGRVGPPRPVEGLPPAASYPFLFRHDGVVYCTPETAHDRRVELYRATSYPDSWERVGTLIDGVAAGDPTVFRHEDRWWLLCTDVEGGRHGRLLGFHAPDLAGPWRLHPANPLKTDVRSARPAGTPFVHEGGLYRPAQDSTRTYGGAVVINRVLRLSPTVFEEEIAARVEPDPRYPKGLHTLSAAGDVTLLDGKRRRMMWSATRYEIRAILRARLGIAGRRSGR
jgi:hypothetical protein